MAAHPISFPNRKAEASYPLMIEKTQIGSLGDREITVNHQRDSQKGAQIAMNLPQMPNNCFTVCFANPNGACVFLKNKQGEVESNQKFFVAADEPFSEAQRALLQKIVRDNAVWVPTKTAYYHENEATAGLVKRLGLLRG